MDLLSSMAEVLESYLCPRKVNNWKILWEVSNNEAEYEALIHGLHLAISLGIKRLLVYSDSLLIVQQVNKEWDCNKETMDAYVQEVRVAEPIWITPAQVRESSLESYLVLQTV
jgi:ribonuclease HI